MPNITPLLGYILVRPLDETDEYAGGLVAPESSKDKPAKGKVLAVSKDCPVSVGDTVIYKRYGGQELREKGELLKLLKFDELMGKYK